MQELNTNHKIIFIEVQLVKMILSGVIRVLVLGK